MNAPPRPLPLSRPFVVATLPSGGRNVTVEATPAECLAVASACGLVAVKSLLAQLVVIPTTASLNVTGSVKAVVTQACTVSLEPFDAAIDEPVDMQFMPESGVAAWMKKHSPDPNEDLAYEIDPPDMIIDGKIDLGAVATEFLSLGLDPYPRKPGVAFEPGPDQVDKDPSPFAALAQWKKPE